jgi:hypothetical protein
MLWQKVKESPMATKDLSKNVLYVHIHATLLQNYSCLREAGFWKLLFQEMRGD